MPMVRIDPAFEMHYLIDDYTDPWRDADRCVQETLNFIVRATAGRARGAG